MAQSKFVARFMMVKANMTVRNFNLVLPLAQKATAMREIDTTDSNQARSSAVSKMIGANLRFGDVDSKTNNSTLPTMIMPGIRTSTMATRITTTRITTIAGRGLSADENNHNKVDFSFTELVQAYFDCRKHKRNTASALRFEQNLERNLLALYDELLDGTYAPGTSICFVITRPKAREVWAADFRDRIVHHLFYNKISPRFYASFIADSCACIPTRGTLYAAKRLESKVRSITQNWTVPAFYLKCDLANFFVSIDKDVLYAQLAKKITEPYWLELAKTILYHDPRADFEFRGKPQSIELVPAHKRLVNQPSNLGLPIGNLSSQFFANIYLNELDQYAKHVIGAKHYIRYVDDFLILHESPKWLNKALADINAFLPARLNANLNPSKTILQPIDRGVDFVGQVIRPFHRTTRKRSVNEAIRRINITPDSVLLEVANSYFGLLGQSTKSQKSRAKIANVLRWRGHTINKDLSKTYRKSSHVF
jgi:RNA-directed DNA polymerase